MSEQDWRILDAAFEDAFGAQRVWTPAKLLAVVMPVLKKLVKVPDTVNRPFDRGDDA